jgi:hypothetical protein
MARILKPGGHLFVSFDYWYDPVDCGGRQAFGVPVRVFSRADVWGMLELAAAADLDNVGIDTGGTHFLCQDKVVKWLGLEYTFMNLLFQKQ